MTTYFKPPNSYEFLAAAHSLQLLDQIMPMLRTLEILEIITPTETDRRRAQFKRVVTKPPKSARALANGLRRRMDEAAKQAAQQTTGTHQKVQTMEGECTPTDPAVQDRSDPTLDLPDTIPPSAVTELEPTRSRKPGIEPTKSNEFTESIPT